MTRRLGILGGGQLALMLAQAAQRLGVVPAVLCPDPQAPAASAAKHFLGDCRNAEMLDALINDSDALTVESENVPYEVLSYIAARKPLRPGLRALSAFRDRLSERAFLQTAGIAGTPWYPAAYEGDIRDGLAELGGAGILKTRTGGYDGLGQVRIQNASQATQAFAALGEQPCVLEAEVAFVKEFSVTAVRALNGTFAFYDASENLAEGGILRQAVVPAQLPASAVKQAQDAVRRIADICAYVGVLTVEFFLLSDGRAWVNEVAPRVHNSAHRTLVDGSISQFENHVRAVMDLPLGSTQRRLDTRMRNILGDEVLTIDALLSDPQALVHLYGKTEIRPGRKMGHVVHVTTPEKPRRSA